MAETVEGVEEEGVQADLQLALWVEDQEVEAVKEVVVMMKAMQ